MRCLQVENFLGLTFYLLLKNDITKISRREFYGLCNNYIDALNSEKNDSCLNISDYKVLQVIDLHSEFFCFEYPCITGGHCNISFSKNIIEELRYGKEGKDRVLDKLYSYFVAGIPIDIKELIQKTILKQMPTFINKYKTPISNDTKELHVWLQQDYPPTEHMLFSLDATITALKKGQPLVHTTQTHCFSTKWITNGYRLFAHLLDGTTIEIKLGQNECTDREIKIGHNLEKLLLANDFGFAKR